MGDIVFALIIAVLAFFVVWAIWGQVPWKTVGKVILTILIIVIAGAIIINSLNG